MKIDTDSNHFFMARVIEVNIFEGEGVDVCNKHKISHKIVNI